MAPKYGREPERKRSGRADQLWSEQDGGIVPSERSEQSERQGVHDRRLKRLEESDRTRGPKSLNESNQSARAPREYRPGPVDKEDAVNTEAKVDNEKKHESEGRGRQHRAGDVEDKAKSSIKSTIKSHPLATAGTAVVAVLAVGGGVGWWLYSRHFESTDDAFIDARFATISSQVSGEIVDLAVTDNQDVDAGAVLARIDDRDYQAALAQAKAQVDQATGTIANLDAQIAAQGTRIVEAKHQVTQAQAALTFAQQEDARAQDLYSRQAGTRQSAEQASSNLRQGQSSLAAAQANESAAEKQIAVLRTQRDTAVGQLEQARAGQSQAEANLARIQIVAPVAGRATKIAVAKGNFAQPGQGLMMFVPRQKWITANFKETQLTDMRPGQQVDIRIDGYPGRSFRGRVDSLQAGSGSVFSLLPAENATGNFVKIVQRVPVKIVFDEPPDVFIGPGMSVVPTVRVR
jgi:membrane fusion protein (multidrug efflux system)